MTDPDPPEGNAVRKPEGEPPRSRLNQILAERPEARPRLRDAVGSLIAASLVAFAAIGFLLIWHFRRRARILRDRLAPPRMVSLAEFDRADGE
jgi:hypothetical protein